MQEDRMKIKMALYKNALSGTWLIKQLDERGIAVDKTALSAVLSGSRKGPKAEAIIKASLDILSSYETAMQNA